MPKSESERTAKRRKEIIDACESIYREQGFNGVTIKQISTETSFTRPSIYNYFETKDEILLALLEREYDLWCDQIETLVKPAETADRATLAALIAQSLENRDLLLRIQNMNLFEMEQNCRTGQLASFKLRYLRAVTALSDILKAYKPSSTTDECENFYMTFSAFLIGMYPFVFHTEKQLDAMALANVIQKETSICDMVKNCLLALLPEK